MKYVRALKPSHKKLARTTFVVVACLFLGIGLWWLLPDSSPSSVEPVQEQFEVDFSPPQAPQLPSLQPIVDDWLQENTGTYSIKVTDTSGRVLAEHNSQEVYFAASIYKIYVAYVGYQKIDDGSYSMDDSYISGYSRGQCLDAMIRDSDSPCAEAMWLELGKDEITQKMTSYGLTDTSLAAVTTTASDAAAVMANIARGTDLSPESRVRFMDSLKNQEAKFRRGLPSGFTNFTVYNKVGWNLDQEWHDAAIIELGNDQELVVSVFSNGAGHTRIADLGATLETALQ